MTDTEEIEKRKRKRKLLLEGSSIGLLAGIVVIYGSKGALSLSGPLGWAILALFITAVVATGNEL